jgi:hypothetical protein
VHSAGMVYRQKIAGGRGDEHSWTGVPSRFAEARRDGTVCSQCHKLGKLRVDRCGLGQQLAESAFGTGQVEKPIRFRP